MELAPRRRPQWPRRRVTAQGPVLPGWVGGWSARGCAQPAGRRLQGTQRALYTPLEMSGAGSRQGTESTQPAPGLPPKSRLEKRFIVEKKKMKRNCFSGGGGGMVMAAASRSVAAGGVVHSEQGRVRFFTVSVVALHIFAANIFVVNIFTV